MTDSLKTDSTSAGQCAREEGQRPPRSVVTECDLPDAPEKVWRALTIPELLSRWLPDALQSEILAAEPYRLLRYRWPASEHDRDAEGQPLDSVVTFELTGTPAGGTHLRVIHRLLVTVVAVDGPVLSESASVVPIKARRQEPVAVAHPELLRWAA